jgi:hypothetical protein
VCTPGERGRPACVPLVAHIADYDPPPPSRRPLHIPPGESPDAALCLHRAHAAGIDSTAKRGASTDFPPCVFTQRQLVQLLRLAGPCFPALRYSMPAECVSVWEGRAAGGVDVGRGP